MNACDGFKPLVTVYDRYNAFAYVHICSLSRNKKERSAIINCLINSLQMLLKVPSKRKMHKNTVNSDMVTRDGWNEIFIYPLDHKNNLIL